MDAWLLFFVPSSSRCCCCCCVGLGRSVGRVGWCSSIVSRILVCCGVYLLWIAVSRYLVSFHPDRDARIQASIGTIHYGCEDGQFEYSYGVAFDHHRGLLFVVDSNNHRVQVFCSDDGSFVSKFGEYGIQPGQFQNPRGLAIDHDHDRIFVADSGNHRVQVWSLSEQSFLSCVGQFGSGDLEFFYPQGIAIDKHHHRIIIVDSHNHRLMFLSLIDLSFLFCVGGKHGKQPGKFYFPTGIAIDDDRHRIIVSDTGNHRVQVLSLIDGSFLFEFGSQDGQLDYPQGLCVDNQGRIIVADHSNVRLQSFTHEGHPISSFDCVIEYPSAVAFDEHRGLIAFSAENRVRVIGANHWLADTFTWRPDRHRYAPSWMKQAVLTMTMIRSLVDDSAMSMIPNELLFEIFSMLEPPENIPDEHQALPERATSSHRRWADLSQRSSSSRCAMM